jgi:hypothetical protein
MLKMEEMGEEVEVLVQIKQLEKTKIKIDVS